MTPKDTLKFMIKDQITNYVVWTLDAQKDTSGLLFGHKDGLKTMRETIAGLYFIDVFDTNDFHEMEQFFYETVTNAGLSYSECVH